VVTRDIQHLLADEHRGTGNTFRPLTITNHVKLWMNHFGCSDVRSDTHSPAKVQVSPLVAS